LESAAEGVAPAGEGCGVSAVVEGFGRGETTAPCSAAVGDEGLVTAEVLGVCAAGFEEAAGIAMGAGCRASAGKVTFRLTPECSACYGLRVPF
jgi:hypothetical protein